MIKGVGVLRNPRKLTAISFTLLLAACSTEQASRGPELIKSPTLDRLPTAEELNQYYPPDAAKAGVVGLITVDCQVETSGRLKNCSVVSETPTGFGFGEAALKMAQFFKLRSLPAGSLTYDGKIWRYRINFIRNTDQR